ncbi:hypothetical protein T02_1109, partial [Trichinella nativa]
MAMAVYAIVPVVNKVLYKPPDGRARQMAIARSKKAEG